MKHAVIVLFAAQIRLRPAGSCGYQRQWTHDPQNKRREIQKRLSSLIRDESLSFRGTTLIGALCARSVKASNNAFPMITGGTRSCLLGLKNCSADRSGVSHYAFRCTALHRGGSSLQQFHAFCSLQSVCTWWFNFNLLNSSSLGDFKKSPLSLCTKPCFRLYRIPSAFIRNIPKPDPMPDVSCKVKKRCIYFTVYHYEPVLSRLQALINKLI